MAGHSTMLTDRVSIWPRLLILAVCCGMLMAGIVAVVYLIDRTDSPVREVSDLAEVAERDSFLEDPASFRGKEVTLTAFVFPMLPSRHALPELREPVQTDSFEITSTPITQGNVMFYVVRPKGKRDELFAHIPVRAAITPGILANQRVAVSFFCGDGDLQLGNVVRSMSPLPR